MAEKKKFEDYSTPVKVVAVILAVFYVLSFLCIVVGIGMLLLDQEYFKALAYTSFWLTGTLWTTSRKRKRKIKKLEIELADLKASRRVDENTAFMKGWQGGINFQRDIFMAAMRRNLQN